MLLVHLLNPNSYTSYMLDILIYRRVNIFFRFDQHLEVPLDRTILCWRWLQMSSNPISHACYWNIPAYLKHNVIITFMWFAIIPKSSVLINCWLCPKIASWNYVILNWVHAAIFTTKNEFQMISSWASDKLW